MSWECVNFYHVFIFGWITPLSKKTVSGNVVRVEYTMDLVINTFIFLSGQSFFSQLSYQLCAAQYGGGMESIDEHICRV